MKKLVLVFILLISTLSSCDDHDCPDDMEECTLQDGTTICVPKGKC